MEIRRQTSYHETLTRASPKSTYKDKDKHRSKGNYKHPYLPGGIQAPDALPRNDNQDQENAEAKKICKDKDKYKGRDKTKESPLQKIERQNDPNWIYMNLYMNTSEHGDKSATSF